MLERNQCTRIRQAKLIAVVRESNRLTQTKIDMQQLIIIGISKGGTQPDARNPDMLLVLERWSIIDICSVLCSRRGRQRIDIHR